MGADSSKAMSTTAGSESSKEQDQKQHDPLDAAFEKQHDPLDAAFEDQYDPLDAAFEDQYDPLDAAFEDQYKKRKKPPKITTAFHGYEFGGPTGAVGMMLGLPVGVYALTWAAGKPSLKDTLLSLRPALENMIGPGLLPAAGKGLVLVSGWMAFQAFLDRVLWGRVVEGSALPTVPPTKIKYTINGHRAFWVTVIVAGVIQKLKGSLSKVYDVFPMLRHGAILFAAVLSVYLYKRSFNKKDPSLIVADAGLSPSKIYNFFMGRELNPRIGGFDLKVFCELRPGLIGWSLINAGMAAKQYDRTGAISLPMAFVNLFQGLYVWDALYFEQSILSTMDVTTEGFGYMLAFGDLVWVPFVYSLQAQHLADHTPNISTPYCLGVAALGAFGYWVFRGSNLQKDQFRRNPQDFEGYTTLKTKRGTNLLVDGWWKVARKINYTGDIIMATSWSMFCGGNPITYFYPIYLSGLLFHRALRDDAFCAQKYGADWEEYKRQVPYLMVPGLI